MYTTTISSSIILPPGGWTEWVMGAVGRWRSLGGGLRDRKEAMAKDGLAHDYRVQRRKRAGSVCVCVSVRACARREQRVGVGKQK